MHSSWLHAYCFPVLAIIDASKSTLPFHFLTFVTAAASLREAHLFASSVARREAPPPLSPCAVQFSNSCPGSAGPARGSLPAIRRQIKVSVKMGHSVPPHTTARGLSAYRGAPPYVPQLAANTRTLQCLHWLTSSCLLLRGGGSGRGGGGEGGEGGSEGMFGCSLRFPSAPSRYRPFNDLPAAWVCYFLSFFPPSETLSRTPFRRPVVGTSPPSETHCAHSQEEAPSGNSSRAASALPQASHNQKIAIFWLQSLLRATKIAFRVVKKGVWIVIIEPQKEIYQMR